MKITDVEYYEYECGSYCSPSGCHGHETDIPVAFEINGVRFVVEGYDGGDYPNSDTDDTVKRVKEVVAALSCNGSNA